MKQYCLELPYFKKGDDLSHYLSETKSVSEAFLMHAEALEAGAAMCRRMAEFPELEVQADCHMIDISGPQEILDKLVAEDVLSIVDWGDDEEEGECDEGEDFMDCEGYPEGCEGCEPPEEGCKKFPKEESTTDETPA